ncbi:putative ATP-grasp-modified RiPP [Embleya sp. NPDC005575]|uniref:putative ATP-grasp-modified RiPP n=1 Tax=Embleya sp. NPDC005575 TaxID=3156892 RepID=UPI0033B72783
MTSRAALPAPFGMRHLTEAPARPVLTMHYDPELQIGVTAEGNPWHVLMPGDTKTETQPDGRSDGDGTDLW